VKKITFLPELIFSKTDGYGNKKSCKLPNSAEEIRSMWLACITVFARHNKVPEHQKILVQPTPDVVHDEDDANDPAEGWGGMAWSQREYTQRQMLLVDPKTAQTYKMYLITRTK